MSKAWATFAGTVALSLTISAQQDSHDYWGSQREMIRRGQQAIMMCNGLFTSNRTLDQIYSQELKFLPEPIGSAAGGDYLVDRARRAVAIGKAGSAPVMRAAFRDGIGCVILAPDQTFGDIDKLPSLTLAAPSGDPAAMPWPDGDLVAKAPLPANVDAKALQAASDWSFNRPSPEQVTLSLLVVQGNQIIHERYAPGVDMATRTRTWSTAKSLASTLIGMLVDRGTMQLDTPLGIPWLPPAASPEQDPRSAITLRHVLNMSSGLETVDNGGLEYATGSGLAYWAGASSERGARSRALIRVPGTSFDYENYDTLAAVYAMKRAIGNDRDYLEFPRKALLDRIGMRNTLISTDRFGDFILSSQVYTNARDLARLGLLYLQQRRLERPAPAVGVLDQVRAHARAIHGRARQQLRRTLLARARQSHGRAEGRVLHQRQSRPVHGDRAVKEPGDRPARARLRAPGLQPVGHDARSAEGDQVIAA